MTRDTEGLIRHLAESTGPVRPLARPWVRAAQWFALAVPYVAIMVVVMSPRPDLVAKLSDLRFVTEEAAALATGILAAVAAFVTVVPGYDRRLLMLPVLPLALWLGSLGQGCVRDWMQLGLHGLSLRSDWLCLPAIALVGALPAMAIAIMLRRGAPLTPYLTAALGGLAAAGLGNVGLRLFHREDASLMVLVWQVGAVFVLSALTGCAGRYLLNWQSIVERARRGAVLR